MVQPSRRGFLGGLLAASVTPKVTWADAGSPHYLSAAKTPDGAYILCGLDSGLNTLFQIDLPTRGHAAAAHPTRPEAVAFARRPGTYAIVIDCLSGATTATLTAPEGRHFYGHGAFSSDGSLLYTTENDYGAGQGRIGVWDVRRDYARIGEWDSGGVGPHEIKRLPGSDVLVVANGGIETHPDAGRAKLNLPTMQSNLAYLEDGAILDVAALPADHQRNSIRHLAVSEDGLVAFAMQWQGDGAAPALAGVHLQGSAPVLLEAADADWQAMNGYLGSVAFARGGAEIAVTSPRGGQVQVFDTRSRSLIRAQSVEDICGVAPSPRGFVATSGQGRLFQADESGFAQVALRDLAWDNHLVQVG